MSEPVKFTAGNWNPFSTIRSIGDAATRAVRQNHEGTIQSHGFTSKKHLRNAQEFLNTVHQNALDWNRQNYAHETEFQTHMSNLEKDRASHEMSLQKEHTAHIAGLTEAQAAATHGRNLEFMKAGLGSAQGGTAFKLSFPEGPSLEMTTKAPKTRAPKQVAPAAEPTPAPSPEPTPAPAAVKKNFPSVKLSEEPQQEGPASSVVSTPKKSGPAVGRDPKTGRAIKLTESSSAPAPAAKKKKPVVAATPSVVRDPKTGRARSVKQK